MKFKKTALALAVAAVAAAPMAQAEVKLSGQVAIFLGGSDADGDAGDPTLSGDDTTVNVTATHTMDNGLTGYAVARWDAGLTDSSPVADAVRVGIKGGFGDFRLGDSFNPIEYGQLANDSLRDVGGNIEEQSIGYQGVFGPVTFGVVWAPERNAEATGNGTQVGGENVLGNDDDSAGAGIKLALGGFTVGVGAGSVGNSDRMSAGASFGFAGVTLAVAFKDFDTSETIGVQAKYGIGKLSLGLTFESISDDLAAAATEDGDTLIRFDGGYDLGGGMNVSTRINVRSDDSDSAGDLTDYRVMLVKTW